MNDQGKGLRYFAGAFCIVGLIVVFTLMSRESQSKAEANLLNFLLFLFSISSSWIFSKIYSEQSASESLRDYGVQTARGVMVLQSQLTNLIERVSVKRQSFPQDEVTKANFEHIEETLKGFQSQADATLRGIAGVIGDALKQYNDTITQINIVRDNKNAEKQKIITEASQHALSDVDAEALWARLAELEQRANEKMTALANAASLPIEIPKRERLVKIECPNCQCINQLVMSEGAGQTRYTACRECKAEFNLHTDGRGDYFTRIIKNTSLNALQETGSDRLSYREPNSFMFTAIKKNFTQRELLLVVQTVNKALLLLIGKRVPFKMSTVRVTVQELIATSESISNKKVSDIFQLLYWGRFFTFDELPSQNAIVHVHDHSIVAIIAALYRAVGFGFGKSGAVWDEGRETSDAKGFLDFIPSNVLESIIRSCHDHYVLGQKARPLGG